MAQLAAHPGRPLAALCSRHWFFGAQLILDGEPAPETLMQIVKATLKANPNNSVIGFKDNSSAIRCACMPALDYCPGMCAASLCRLDG